MRQNQPNSLCGSRASCDASPERTGRQRHRQPRPWSLKIDRRLSALLSPYARSAPAFEAVSGDVAARPPTSETSVRARMKFSSVQDGFADRAREARRPNLIRACKRFMIILDPGSPRRSTPLAPEQHRRQSALEYRRYSVLIGTANVAVTGRGAAFPTI